VGHGRHLFSLIQDYRFKITDLILAYFGGNSGGNVVREGIEK
jgi:hypothetical protein